MRKKCRHCRRHIDAPSLKIFKLHEWACEKALQDDEAGKNTIVIKIFYFFLAPARALECEEDGSPNVETRLGLELACEAIYTCVRHYMIIL